MNQLEAEVQVYNILKDRIKEEFSLWEEDPVLLDTVDGETSLEEIVLGIARDIKRTEAFADAMKFIMADNAARLERFQRKAERLRKTVGWALQETGRKKFEGADITVSQRDGTPNVVIYSESEVPPNYCQVKYIPIKAKIKNAMELGEQVPGAEWSNSAPVLTIRTR